MSQALLLWSLPLLVLSSPAAANDGQDRNATNKGSPAGAKESDSAPARAPHLQGNARQAASPGRSGSRQRAASLAPAPKNDAPRILALVNLSAHLTRTQVKRSLEFYELLRKSFGGAWPKTLSPLEDFDLRALLAGDRPDWSLEQAKTLLAEAKVAYATLKVRAALSHLEAAREILLRRVSVDQAKGPLAEVWAYLVMCRNSLGQADLARREAANLALVSPEGKPLPEVLWNRYRPTPSQNTRVRRRRPRPSRKHLAQILVPRGASIYLNFKRLPSSNQGHRDLAQTKPAGRRPRRPSRPGRSASPDDATVPNDQAMERYTIPLSRPVFLAVEAPGKQHYFSMLQPRTGPVRVVLTPAPRDRRADLRRWLDALRGRQPTPDQIQALAAKTKASLFLLIQEDAKGLSLVVLDSRKPAKPLWTKRFPPPPATSTGWPKVTVQDLSGLTAILLPPKPRPSRTALARTARKAARKVANKKNLPIKKPRKKPLWKKWYFWVALGAVAVAATVFAVTKDKQSDQVDIRVSRP